MKVSFLLLVINLLTIHTWCLSQSTVLDSLSAEQEVMERDLAAIKEQISIVKCSLYKEQLKSYGLPSAGYLEHTAYFFEYSEEHEQAKWVAHMITPEVKDLGEGRTNDFRVDPLVTTGTADQQDYFNYYPDRAEKEQYVGFGYDRGHLAPSADFRWYGEAVSESFYYSNMSPQDPELNREKWAELEAMLRGYVIRHNTPIAIVTAPILTDSLSRIVQSPNGLSIPEHYIKLAYDAKNSRMIGFLLANKKQTKPLESYAISVDDLEKLSGYDYFPNVDQSLESRFDITAWFSEYEEGSVEPIKQNTLPLGHFNTIAAAKHMNKYRKITVCGKVVSSRYSHSGHAWLNLDKKYPNDYFSVMIYKDQLTNFTYDPVEYLKDKEICVEGEVGKFGTKPVMKVLNTELINYY